MAYIENTFFLFRYCWSEEFCDWKSSSAVNSSWRLDCKNDVIKKKAKQISIKCNKNAQTPVEFLVESLRCFSFFLLLLFLRWMQPKVKLTFGTHDKIYSRQTQPELKWTKKNSVKQRKRERDREIFGGLEEVEASHLFRYDFSSVLLFHVDRIAVHMACMCTVWC